jgi:hypothetical protein
MAPARHPCTAGAFGRFFAHPWALEPTGIRYRTSLNLPQVLIGAKLHFTDFANFSVKMDMNSAGSARKHQIL